MEKKVRDQQRSKMYTAEHEAKQVEYRLSERIETVPEIQDWVDKITSSMWWSKYKIKILAAEPVFCVCFENAVKHIGPEKLSPKCFTRSITVTDGRGTRAAYGYPSQKRISLPKWARSKIVILHEVAHIISPEEPAHGRGFCRLLCDMVQRFIGKQEADTLRGSFKKYRVKYSKQFTRPDLKGRRGNPEALRLYREQRDKGKQNGE